MRNLATLLEDPASGRASIAKTLEQYLRDIEQTLADFERAEAMLTAVQRAASEPFSTRARTHLDVCLEIAREVGTLLEQGASRVVLAQAGARLREATECVNQAFLDFREASLVALGPTRVAGVNLILFVIDAIDRKQASMDALDGPLGLESARIRSALVELDVECGLAQALRGLGTVLSRLLFLPAHIRPSTLRSALIEAARRVDEEAVHDGPSQHHRVNVMIRFADAVFRRGREDLALSLRSEVDALRLSISEYAEKIPCVEPPLSAELCAALNESLDMCAVALEDLLECAGGCDTEAFAAARVALLDATTRLHELQGDATRTTETASLRACVRCCASMGPERTTCQQCGAVLPALSNNEAHTGYREGEAYAADQGEAGPCDSILLADA